MVDIWEKKQEIKILSETPIGDFPEFQVINFKIQKLETEINECHIKLKTY